MPRRPNYGFQKQQTDKKKQTKREEKAEKKRLKNAAQGGAAMVEGQQAGDLDDADASGTEG